MKRTVYCMVRTDIPLAQQLVQAAHATLELGFDHHKGEDHTPPHLVLLESKSERNLLEQFERLENEGIKTIKFYEPDDNMGWSAWATQPLPDSMKSIFKRYKLWRPNLAHA